MKEGKCVIVSAPSGSGKTTIVHHLLRVFPEMEFSVSACSRPIRKGEEDGKDYYFLSVDEFRKKIEEKAFIEWEEVYDGHYYGTLRSEIGRIWEKGKVVIFDVDVVGAIKLKNIFSDLAFALFIMPPSLEELRKRLIARGHVPNLEERLDKAARELEQSPHFDAVVVNDNLSHAKRDTEQLLRQFLAL